MTDPTAQARALAGLVYDLCIFSKPISEHALMLELTDMLATKLLHARQDARAEAMKVFSESLERYEADPLTYRHELRAFLLWLRHRTKALTP